WAEGRRVRADPAAVRRGPRTARGLVAPRRDDPGGADDDRRESRGAHAGQREADAGVQLDRPHRLYAGRARGVRRRTAPWSPGLAVLWRGVHVHEPRCIRGGGGPPETDRRHIRAGDLLRAGPARTAPRRLDAAVPVVPDRHPTARRLLGEGVRDPRRGRGRRLAYGPCGPRRAQRRARRVLLPEGRGLHVYA